MIMTVRMSGIKIVLQRLIKQENNAIQEQLIQAQSSNTIKIPYDTFLLVFMKSKSMNIFYDLYNIKFTIYVIQRSKGI